MIVFGIVCWVSEASQIPELRRCLESIKDYRVILVDGKWYDMEGDNQTSLPLAIEIIDSYPNVERITAVNRPEWENRNIYFSRCKEDDTLIILDTDEYITTDCPIIPPLDVNSFMVNGYDSRCGGGVVLKRGINKPHNMRYAHRHNLIVDERDKNTMLNFAGLPPKGLTIHHDKQYRSEYREKLMNTRNHLEKYR